MNWSIAKQKLLWHRVVAQYFLQPIGDPTHRLVINPWTFWQIQFLETCWTLDLQIDNQFIDYQEGD